MIKLSNGHQSRFFSASGAMAYLHGWPWEQPFRWVGLLDPYKFTIITKTLTWEPIVGNLKLWCWWRCIRFLGGGNVLNSVGLTNPGLTAWSFKWYPKIAKYDYNVIVSVMVQNVLEAQVMAKYLNGLNHIVGVQLNVSCPNIHYEQEQVEAVCDIVRAFARVTNHPLILKLGYQHGYVSICRELKGTIEAVELINAVPWPIIFPNRISPLAKYNLVGAVSGPWIIPYAREALDNIHEALPAVAGHVWWWHLLHR